MSTGQEGDRFRGVTRAVPAQRDGADVQDHVVQQLSSVRLTLRGVEGVLGGGPLAGRLRDGIEELDDAVDGLRGRFIEVEEQAPIGNPGLAGRLLVAVMEGSLPRGLPGLHFAGMDVPLPEDVESGLCAVLRQALTEVAQHAAATDVEVLVAATADRLTAEITEYGTVKASCAIALGDLHRRARDHGGAFSVEPRQHSGIRMTWTVPLRQLHAVH